MTSRAALRGAPLRRLVAAGFGLAALVSCGTAEDSLFKDGSPGGANAGSSGGVLGGGANGSGGPEACGVPGSTRSCCGSGTQTCGGTNEFHTWSPCLDASGKELTCSGTGGGGNEDGGGAGTGGGGNEDGGGPGTGGGGNEDGGGPGAGGGGNEDGGGPGTGGGGTELPPPSCGFGVLNDEPNILVAYAPADGQSVSGTGQIKVWVADEWPQMIAPGEQIDPTTGGVTKPGDRTAKAPDGYLFEPVLYIANMGFFPAAIKGWYNNDPPNHGPGIGTQVQGMDPPPAQTFQEYVTEDIWNVAAFGLKPGTYSAEFVVHDGDRDRAIGCISIVVD